jgi:hypothetical protein
VHYRLVQVRSAFFFFFQPPKAASTSTSDLRAKTRI